MTDLEEVPTEHTCCWHTTTMAITTAGTSRSEVCCHCGVKRVTPPTRPPVPAGHGPHYPWVPHGWTQTG